MYLPDVLLQQGMDDDPDQGIKDNIEDIQHTVLIIGLRKGPGVYTKATGVWQEQTKKKKNFSWDTSSNG